MKTTIGGERLGSGGKMIESTQHYERSTHDLSYLWRSSASNGTLIPFMSQVALPGDTWDIDLSTQVMTLPTLGPLFGSYKIQLDLFEIPIRLYQGKLHMNLLNVGMKMEDIKLPLIALNAYATPMLEDNDQVNSSCIFSYLGIRGLGRNYQGGSGDVKRYFNAVPYLGYLDIFKNYYANKQEDKAYFIHNPMTMQNYASIQKALLYNGTTALIGDCLTGARSVTGGIVPQMEFLIDYGTQWAGQTPQLDLNYVFLATNSGTYSLNQLFGSITVYNNTGTLNPGTWVVCKLWKNPTGVTTINQIAVGNQKIQYTKATMRNNQPILKSFDLNQIDKIREEILKAVSQTSAVIVNDFNLEPIKSVTSSGSGGFSITSSQEGLFVKT